MDCPTRDVFKQQRPKGIAATNHTNKQATFNLNMHRQKHEHTRQNT
jgi:hypothetical protein